MALNIDQITHSSLALIVKNTLPEPEYESPGSATEVKVLPSTNAVYQNIDQEQILENDDEALVSEQVQFSGTE